MIKEFKALLTAVKKGKELSNAATWKNVQIAGNAIAVLLTSLLALACGWGYCFDIDQTQLESIGMGVATVYGVANSMITVLTSKKVGLGKHEEPDPSDF